MAASNSPKFGSLDEIERRSRFYSSDEAKKHLKKYGIPKSKTALKALVSTMFQDATPEMVDSVGFVYFQVHPQQINIRDRANGRLIISIEK